MIPRLQTTPGCSQGQACNAFLRASGVKARSRPPTLAASARPAGRMSPSPSSPPSGGAVALPRLVAFDLDGTLWCARGAGRGHPVKRAEWGQEERAASQRHDGMETMVWGIAPRGVEAAKMARKGVPCGVQGPGLHPPPTTLQFCAVGCRGCGLWAVCLEVPPRYNSYRIRVRSGGPGMGLGCHAAGAVGGSAGCQTGGAGRQDAVQQGSWGPWALKSRGQFLLMPLVRHVSRV